MGCRGITPKLVGLARRLEGRPFHLIASHGQDISSRDSVNVHLQAHGMWSFQPNLTITKNGRHPDVQCKRNSDGVRLMPYYLVFDHTGRLVKHNMGGAFHGGDGSMMFTVVDELLAKTPDVYLGPEPFEQIEPLVSLVAKGKPLGAVVKEIDRALRNEPEATKKAELERLLNMLARHRDRRIVYVGSLEGSDPSRVLPALKELAKELKGTSLVEGVDSKLNAMMTTASLAAAVDFQKLFQKIKKRYERVKPKKRTEAFIEKTVEKLEALLEGRQDLQFAEVVRTWMNTLG